MAWQTSPSASGQGLPASRTQSAASVVRRSRSHAAARERTCARSPAGSDAHSA